MGKGHVKLFRSLIQREKKKEKKEKRSRLLMRQGQQPFYLAHLRILSKSHPSPTIITAASLTGALRTIADRKCSSSAPFGQEL